MSINLFVKTGKKAKDALGQVFHHSLYGKRGDKYDELVKSGIISLSWKNVEAIEPHFAFVPRNNDLGEYANGFSLDEFYLSSSTGVETGNDEHFIKFETSEFEAELDCLEAIEYRPFDYRICLYDNKTLRRAAYSNFKNMIKAKENISLVFPRQSTSSWTHIQVTKSLFDNRGQYSNKGRSSVCPLYIYSDDLLAETTRTPNLNPSIVQQIATGLGLTSMPEKTDAPNTFAPIDLLDYIYAVLHSPSYRETYKEFLKIDFPRVPYPTDAAQFWQLVALGGELRKTHLLESRIAIGLETSGLQSKPINYPIAGNNVMDKLRYEAGRVYINATQYFENVPEIAWYFYIGGYQPAQKWLKDRKGRALSFEDIQHYQKIIHALTQTDRLMREIDTVFSLT